jgi:predicted ferric reductase
MRYTHSYSVRLSPASAPSHRPGEHDAIRLTKSVLRRQRGALVVALLCLIPVALWAIALPFDVRFSGLSTTLTSIGAVLGIAGVTSFALNLVLGARLKAFDGFFEGLDNLYRVHRINGRAAFLLLLAHGILMFGSQATVSFGAALRWLLPTTSWTVTLGFVALVCMAVAIALTLYGRLGHEAFVYVQRTFGVIFIVAAIHVFTTPGTKAVSPPLRFYLIAVTALGLAAYVYRSVLGESLVPRHDYRVAAVNHLGPGVMEISMSPQEEPLKFVPGQFVFVTFQSETLRRHFHPFSIFSEGQFGVLVMRPGAVAHQYHPFSITSAPNGRTLSVVVKAVGDYTTAMSQLESGARARVEGPYGAFSYLHIDNHKQVWIAGGIGITPFLSMARSLEPSEHQIDFYYAMEDGHQGYYLDEFYAIADRVPRFRVIPIRRDQLGFVTADDIAGVSRNLSTKDILICGPPPMVQSLTAQLANKGVPREQIHYELFGFV